MKKYSLSRLNVKTVAVTVIILLIVGEITLFNFRSNVFYCSNDFAPHENDIQAGSEERGTASNSEEMIHLVTNYALMNEPPWSVNQTEKNTSRLRERQEELDETLQRNLNHHFIGSLHVLVNQKEAEKRLKELNLYNKHKLNIFHTKAMPTFRDFFQYIRYNLQNKMVALTNMDIYFGEGFEALNRSLFVKHNITYVLTRHGRRENRCDMWRKPRYCGTGNRVSHDTYLLVPTADDLEDNVLAEMNYQLNLMEAEYRLAWIFKNLMKRNLVNPCQLLRTYHNHCIDIHGKHRPSVAIRRSRLVMVQPTDSLLP